MNLPMNPATLIEQARAAGVSLALSATGSIKATGEAEALRHWLPIIRDHKAALIAQFLQHGPARAWLIHFANDAAIELHYATPTTRAEVLAAYKDASTATPFMPVCQSPTTPLGQTEEARIRTWLARIGEADPSTITEVLHACQTDAGARAYFLARAGQG